MSRTQGKGGVAWLVLMGAFFVPLAGCSDPIVSSGIAHPGSTPVEQPVASPPEVNPVVPTVAGAAGGPPENTRQPGEPAVPVDPARPREFPVEGTNGALRITFDDLDLMKLLNMDPVTSDCVEKMPAWLRGLDGKMVRIRGFMKPSGVTEGIPQFVFVRSTDLCCFGPKGKVYHLIAVTLKKGQTTDYIELKPFDVEGKFRIDKVEIDDGLIFLLYHIDEATIIGQNTVVSPAEEPRLSLNTIVGGSNVGLSLIGLAGYFLVSRGSLRRTPRQDAAMTNNLVHAVGNVRT